MKNPSGKNQELLKEISSLKKRILELEKAELAREQAEKALRKNEQKFRILFDHAFQFIGMLTPDGTLINANRTAMQFAGISEGDCIGKPFWNTPWWSHSREMQNKLRDALKEVLTGNVVRLEVTHSAWDGSIHFIDFSLQPVNDETGKIIFLIAEGRDITEHKKLEETLQESEEKCRAFYNTSKDCIFITSVDGRWLDLNDAAVKLFGYDNREELLKVQIKDLYANPDHRTQHLQIIDAQEYAREQRFAMRKKDGTVIDTLITSIIRKDSAGRIIGYQGTICDITENKLAKSQREAALDALAKSEAWMSSITNSAQDAILMMNPAGRISFWNPAAEYIFGYTYEEAMGQNLRQFLTPKRFLEVYSRAFDKFKKNGLGEATNKTIELRVCRKNGEEFPIELSLSTVEFEDGLHAVGIIRDITVRKQAEEALRESEKKSRLLMETTSAGIYLIQDNMFVYVNPAFEAITGYSLNELADTPFWDLIHPDFREMVKQKGIRRQKGEEPPERYEFKIIIKDGQEKWIELSAASFIDLNNTPTIMGSMFDVTERKQAEDALRRSEHLYRTIFENTGNATLLLNEDTKIILANSEFEKLSGYSKTEIEGEKSWTEFIYKEDLNRMLEYHRMRRINATAAPRKYEFRFIDRYGNIKDISLCAEMIPGTKQSITSLHDITERKRAEKTLEESQRKLTDIIEFLPDATLIIDKDGEIIAWNRAMEAMTGVKKEDIIGKGNHEYALPFYGDRRSILIDHALHPDQDMEEQYTTIQRVGDIILGETFTPNLPHGNIYLSATASVLRDYKGEIIAAIECIRDNTERKRLEERLNRAEKMEALGTLAGGVAHDLNNVLGIMVGYSELIQEGMPKDSLLIKYADNILQSSTRCAAIIQDLLTLARRGVNIAEIVNLNMLVLDYFRTPELEKLKLYHPNVNICADLEEGLLNIKGSPLHLSKTIMNLVSNAAEAISGQGEVTVRTENRYLDHPIRGYDTIQEGDYAVLIISDTGSGISANDLDKIFEPFYTKKVMGRSGTGLGLAVVWGAVKDHRGYIDVQSEKGIGTTFTLYFPVTREELAEVEKSPSLLSFMGRGEFILVVDDVKEQRELAINMLSRLGYQVEAVACGEEAIAYFRNKKADLIILDMIMDPGIDGLETYRRILELSPGQKAVIVSGFSETDRVRNAQEMGAGTFVRKPYILEKIGIAVRKELDGK